MADPPLIVRLIMRIADFPEEVARLILGELPRYCPTRGRLITTPTFGLPRPAPIFPKYVNLNHVDLTRHWMPVNHNRYLYHVVVNGVGNLRGQFRYPANRLQPWGYLQ